MGLPVNQVLCGDCVEVMKSFPEESIDFVQFSPPYWGLRDYGKRTETVWGGDPKCQHKWGFVIKERVDYTGFGRNRRGLNKAAEMLDGHTRKATAKISPIQKESSFCVKCGAWRGQLGLEPTYQMYVEHMVTICREINRVLKKTGSMYIVLGDTYFSRQGNNSNYSKRTTRKSDPNERWHYERIEQGYQPKCLMGIPWRVGFALIDDSWILRSRIIWHKNNPMPGSQKDRLTQTCEVIFHFVKNSKTVLWRNMETGEWVSEKPVQQYRNVETRELTTERPLLLKKRLSELSDEEVEERRKWRRIWQGFDYYYELDAIREAPVSLRPSGNKRRKIPYRPKGGRVGHSVPWSPFKFNLRVRQVKCGKKGFSVEGGKVKELKASEKEIESYVYPEVEGLDVQELMKEVYQRLNRNLATYRGKNRLQNPNAKRIRAFDGKKIRDTARQILKEKGIPQSSKLIEFIHDHFSHPLGKNPGDVILTKHDLAVGRTGKVAYTDPLHVKDYHPLGKNPGDVFKFKERRDIRQDAHVGGNVGLAEFRDRARKEGKPEGHTKGKNPGDVVSERVRANLEHFIPKGSGGHYDYGGLDSKEGKHYAKGGKNPGDVVRIAQEKGRPLAPPHHAKRTRPSDIDRMVYSGGYYHPKGKNPGDYWSLPTKPFKGAHFAVYPEGICILPIKSSSPPNGIVLDPMVGSGTTCVVAKKLGRNFIGIDINPEYCELARKRLNAIPLRLDRFT